MNVNKNVNKIVTNIKKFYNNAKVEMAKQKIINTPDGNQIKSVDILRFLEATNSKKDAKEYQKNPVIIMDAGEANKIWGSIGSIDGVTINGKKLTTEAEIKQYLNANNKKGKVVVQVATKNGKKLIDIYAPSEKALSSYKTELNPELVEELKKKNLNLDNLTNNPDPKLLEYLKKKLEPKLKEDLKNELEHKLVEDLKNRLGPKLGENLKNKLEEYLKNNLDHKLEEYFKNNLDHKLKKYLKNKLDPKLAEDLKNKLDPELVKDLKNKNLNLDNLTIGIQEGKKLILNIGELKKTYKDVFDKIFKNGIEVNGWGQSADEIKDRDFIVIGDGECYTLPTDLDGNPEGHQLVDGQEQSSEVQLS